MLPSPISILSAIEDREREIRAELFVRSMLRRETAVARPHLVSSHPVGESRSPRRP